MTTPLPKPFAGQKRYQDDNNDDNMVIEIRKSSNNLKKIKFINIKLPDILTNLFIVDIGESINHFNITIPSTSKPNISQRSIGFSKKLYAVINDEVLTAVIRKVAQNTEDKIGKVVQNIEDRMVIEPDYEPILNIEQSQELPIYDIHSFPIFSIPSNNR